MKHFINYGWITVFTGILLTLSPDLLCALPQKVLYQGTLRRSGTIFTGNGTFLFRVTDASGASEYWTSGSTVVAVTSGLFRYPLGVDNLGGTGLNAKPFANIPWALIEPYVEVTVDGILLSPREPLSSVPYALYLTTGDAFSVGGSTFVVTGGRVGVGTTNPGALLHFSGGSSVDAKLILEADTANSNENLNPRIEFRQDGNSNTAFIGMEGSAGSKSPGTISNSLLIGSEDSSTVDIHFITDDKVRMTILTNSNVGIGATNPQGLLEVRPSSSDNYSLFVSSQNAAAILTVDKEGDVVIGGASKHDVTANSDLLVKGNVVVDGQFIGHTASGSSIAFTSGGDFIVGTSTMVVTQGRVGIGTTSPAAKLHISSGTLTIDGTGAGITIAGSGVAVLNATQTFSGQNTFTSQVSMPGSGANSLRLGVGAIASGVQGVAIGEGAQAITGAGATTAVGANAIATGRAVSLGPNTTSVDTAMALGYGANASGVGTLAVGEGANASNSYSVAVGNGGANAAGSGAIAMGYGSSASGNVSIALGRTANARNANEFVAGASDYPIDTVYFGKGSTNTAPSAYTIQGTGGEGTNVAGAALQLAGGRGTGSAMGGPIIFKTAAGAGAGTALNALSEAVRISSAGYIGIGTTSPESLAHLLGTNTNLLIEGTGITKAGLQIKTNSTLRWDINAPNGSSDLRFNNGTTDLVTIQQGGNVGIGLTSPKSALDLSGGVLTFGSVSSSSTIRQDLGTDDLIIASLRTATDSDIIFRTQGPNASDTRMVITGLGNVGIGTASPASGKLLDVQGEVQINFPTAGATTIGVCKSGADGGAADHNLVECSATPGDLAEWYESKAGVEPGDLVAATGGAFEFEENLVDPRTGLFTKELARRRIAIMEKSTRAYQLELIGVVSESPYQVLGEAVMKAKAKNAQPVALMGRVPVKVTLENGPIRPGDPLTSSSKPGYAMKAAKTGRVIGTALEAFGKDGPAEGKVLCFVNTHTWVYPSDHDQLKSKVAALESEVRQIRVLLREKRLASK